MGIFPDSEIVEKSRKWFPSGAMLRDFSEGELGLIQWYWKEEELKSNLSIQINMDLESVCSHMRERSDPRKVGDYVAWSEPQKIHRYATTESWLRWHVFLKDDKDFFFLHRANDRMFEKRPLDQYQEAEDDKLKPRIDIHEHAAFEWKRPKTSIHQMPHHHASCRCPEECDVTSGEQRNTFTYPNPYLLIMAFGWGAKRRRGSGAFMQGVGGR